MVSKHIVRDYKGNVIESDDTFYLTEDGYVKQEDMKGYVGLCEPNVLTLDIIANDDLYDY